MKCTIPEISWHNRDPVLSVDIQPSKVNDCYYRLATAGFDTHVLIWLLSVEAGGAATLECAADLTRHSKPVNCVRFSPSGEFLASGDDDANIIIWKLKTSTDPAEFPSGEEEIYKEQWIAKKVLRGHLQDVYDVSWSSDSQNLISGSVDNTAILWEVKSGKNLGILSEHKGFIQGVSWDPVGQYVATVSSDRVCRVYNASSRRVISKIYKGHLPGADTAAKPSHFFHDDTLKSFFRRLTFTPDGEFLIVPSGVVNEPDKKPTNSTLIFCRNCFQKPAVYLPSQSQYTVAVRCCPVLFTLLPMESPPLFELPYRIVIAVATQCSVILYDTQHAAPFAYITKIHYTRLTDISWSSDGRVLVVSSTDGYCSVITFADNELGTVYKAKEKPVEIESKHEKSTGLNKADVASKKTEVNLDVEENANMSFETTDQLEKTDSKLSLAKEELKKDSPDRPVGSISENKDVVLEVDDFSLVYEGTVTQPILESQRPPEGEPSDVKSTEETTKTSHKTIEQSDCKPPVPSNISPNKLCEATKSLQEEALTSPRGGGTGSTPGNSNKKTPRRVQLITLSSPKSKKKLL